MGAVPGGMTVIDVVLDGLQTGTGYAEDFKLGLPSGWETRGPAPLLLAWHGYGGPPAQIFRDTDFPAECERRGWFLLAPRGLDDKSFGWPPAQRNVHAALHWVLARYPVQRSRLYGVGWSMGAQCVLSFAARYQDPRDLRLAAVAGLAGPYDVAETWEREGPAVRAFLELLFGGPPSTRTRNAYRGVSQLEVEPGTARPAATPRMAWNLEHLPTFLAWAEDDPIAYLPAQSAALAGVLRGQGTPVVERRVRGVVPAHDWRIVAARDLCDFLTRHARDLPLPVPRRVLSDGTAAHGGVHLVPEPGALAAVELSADGAAPLAVSIRDTQGLARLQLSGVAFGWPTAVAWRLDHASGDGTQDELAILERAPAPVIVRRDGMPFRGWRYAPPPAARLELGPSRATVFELERDGHEVGLTMPATARIGTRVRIQIPGTGRPAVHVLFLAAEVQEFPLAALDPSDPRWLEVSPLAPTVWFPGVSDPAHGRRIDLGIPPHAALVGRTLHFQALLLEAGTIWSRSPRRALALLR